MSRLDDGGRQGLGFVNGARFRGRLRSGVLFGRGGGKGGGPGWGFEM